MFEKVNPKHPDKVADRIAGALVDLAYKKADNPKIAVEVLLGHGTAQIIAETSVKLKKEEVEAIVYRIARIYRVHYLEVPQDVHLSINQSSKMHCGDNGIFKGCPITTEQSNLQTIAKMLYGMFPSDGKYILADGYLAVCQSYAENQDVEQVLRDLDAADSNVENAYGVYVINPLGKWTGGTDVDCGATNRKLGSDMGDAVTGGGLHGKDLSKADVTLNIYCHIMAQKTGKPYSVFCTIGDECVDGKPYPELVEIARDYINKLGGFEKFAEWGLIR